MTNPTVIFGGVLGEGSYCLVRFLIQTRMIGETVHLIQPIRCNGLPLTHSFLYPLSNFILSGLEDDPSTTQQQAWRCFSYKFGDKHSTLKNVVSRSNSLGYKITSEPVNLQVVIYLKSRQGEPWPVLTTDSCPELIALPSMGQMPQTFSRMHSSSV